MTGYIVETIAAADRAEPARVAPDEVGGSRARSVTAWDISGLLLLTFLVLAVMSGVPRFVDDWFHRFSVLPSVTAAVGVATVVSVVVAAARARSTNRSLVHATLPQRLTAIWRDPPGDWTAFVLGVVLSLPLLGLYTPTMAPDTDSMRLIAAVRHVQRDNLDFLVETQDSWGQHVFLGPVLAVFGSAGLRLFTIISVQICAGVVSWLTRRLSGSTLAAVIAVIALLSIGPMTFRAVVLPMYPVMLTLGSLGCWLAYRALVEGARWYYAAGAALLLVLAQEAHAVGRLLLAVPLLLLILTPGMRQGAATVARLYAFLVVFLLPRLIVNLSEGGLSHLRSNRTDYWITKGYLRQIQIDFWDYDGLDEPFPIYLLHYPGRFVTSLGASGWVIAPLAVLGLLALRARRRWLALAFVGFIAAAMTSQTIQPSPRYFSPLWPGLAALAGVMAAKLIGSDRRIWRLAGAAAFASLTIIFLNTFRSTALLAQKAASRTEEHAYTAAAELIDDGKSVIGTRSMALLSADPDLETYGGHLLPEEDYVTYLTWPSDAEVIEMMERHDIGWVMTNRREHLEIGYNNAWLIPNYRRPARHAEMLRDSPQFCRVLLEDRLELYKLGACPASVSRMTSAS